MTCVLLIPSWFVYHCGWEALVLIGISNASRFSLQLGAATRLPGMTPAAIVHLLNFVTQKNNNQNKIIHNQHSRAHKKPSGPEPSEGGERAGAVS